MSGEGEGFGLVMIYLKLWRDILRVGNMRLEGYGIRVGGEDEISYNGEWE